MTWSQRYRFRQYIRTSLVFWAVLSLIAALVIAPLMRRLDYETNWVVFNYSSDGARALLSVLVGAMETFIVFVLSATLIVVQLASGQSSPRVIALVLATPRVKLALGFLTFTFAYSLGVLGRIEARVPDLHVSIAVLLNLLCIVVFFQFAHQLSTGLRPAALIQLVAERAERVIDQVYPRPFDPSMPEQATKPVPPSEGQVVPYSGPAGVVMAFCPNDIVQFARRADIIVELVPQVGDFIAAGDPLFRVVGRPVVVSPESLIGSVAIGAERTIDQDPRFVFRILVDIANKALSPAINDPTTAVHALDHIQHLLLVLGKRHLDEGEVHDSDGKPRFLYGTPDWPDFVVLAASEVRHFGAGSLQVARRLRAMLERLIETLPEARHPPLVEELALLGQSIERNFMVEEDKKRARVADLQGVGGSEI